MVKTKRTRKGMKSSPDKIIFIIVALLPLFSHLALFWLSSQINGVIKAFTSYDTGNFTFGNFNQVFAIFKDNFSSDLGIAFKNTMIYFLVSLFMVPFSLAMAYVVYKKCIGHKYMKIMFMLPSIVSVVMVAMLFQEFIMSNGPFISFFNGTLGADIPTPLVTERGTLVIALFGVWIGLGGHFPIWFGSMSRIPQDIFEYASLDGIGPFKEFVKIVMPLIWPTFVTQMTFALIGIFGASGNVLLFTEGKYNTWTLSFWIYNTVYNGRANLQPIALALGLCMTVATIPILVIGRLILNRFGEEIQY